MGGSGSKFSKANADLQNACKANDVEAAKKAPASHYLGSMVECGCRY